MFTMVKMKDFDLVVKGKWYGSNPLAYKALKIGEL